MLLSVIGIVVLVGFAATLLFKPVSLEEQQVVKTAPYKEFKNTFIEDSSN